ncbi:hypothetical protein [Legionella erythra]|uniref:Uncharacterized protein n=1 Tax=Legionella erythra TaxID=448 RepID=A0A0W0TTY0_LEGER|nr:hypothetical protein [Legionella erythra]KTC99095.1 hypothetical protein Lery_0634 [Legionella erythra]
MQLKTEYGVESLALELIPRTASGALDLTEATRIAEGGTHVLYRFKESPYVIKLMKQNPDLNQLRQLEDNYAVLYDCFDREGKQRCIREQHVIAEIKYEGQEPQRRALAIVPYEPCFKSAVKFDFKIEPTELDPCLIEQHKVLFEKANAALICGKTPEVDFNLDEYAILDPRIGAILKRLDSDPALKEPMMEFLTHYRDFYQKTDIILDAMGFENILFFKDGQGEWQFKIGSTIKHDTGSYTRELFHAVHEGKPMAMNFVNYTHAYFSPANIRAVNACALKLKLPPVIQDVSLHTADLVQVSDNLPVAERMLSFARHGDFKKVDELLSANQEQLCFSLSDFWAYPLIADEYVKQQQPLIALGKYLDAVSSLPVMLPENKEEAKRVDGAKSDLIQRKKMHDETMISQRQQTAALSHVGFWALKGTDKEKALQDKQNTPCLN